MPASNLNRQPNFEVRLTNVKTWLTPETMSPLGRELFEIAREIEKSDEPALDDKAMERELAKRRGGFEGND